jgi:hypothetical protein
MKRVLLGAAAVAALLSAFAVRPVQADPATSLAATSDGIVPQVETKSADIANQFLSAVPTPDGWQIRHACVVIYTADKSWCLFFPWPS